MKVEVIDEYGSVDCLVTKGIQSLFAVTVWLFDVEVGLGVEIWIVVGNGKWIVEEASSGSGSDSDSDNLGVTSIKSSH
jgi:hypothetical protein